MVALTRYYREQSSAGAWRVRDHPWLVLHRVTSVQRRTLGYRGWRVVPHWPHGLQLDFAQLQERQRLLGQAEHQRIFCGCYPTRQQALLAVESILARPEPSALAQIF